jgi:hypothetical protein
MDRPTAIFSTSTIKLVPYHLVPNCSPLKQHLLNDPLPQLDHAPISSLTDPMIHARAMAQDQTGLHHGDETTMVGMK